MAKRIGRHTLLLTCSPSVIGYAAVGARKEKQGPLADYFDLLSEDSSFGEKTWEQAETLMQKKAVELALQKSSLKKDDIDFLFAGDLLNQCISSAYASREMQIPFFGLYGACSTMSESLSLASLFQLSVQPLFALYFLLEYFLYLAQSFFLQAVPPFLLMK